MVYIATTDLLKIAQEDLEVRKTIAWYLQEKAKSGTPKQREAAVKILKRHPIFTPHFNLLSHSLLALHKTQTSIALDLCHRNSEKRIVKTPRWGIN